MRPSGPRASLGHFVRSTTTISPARRGQRLASGDQHVRQHPLVERHDEAAAGAIDLAAGRRCAGDARETTSTTRPSSPRSVRRSTRAVTRSPCIASPSAPGGMNRSLARADRSRDTKPTPLAVVWRCPTTRSVRLGQAEEVPALAHQFAGVDQRREVALERRPLFARHPQRANQVAGRGRVPHGFAQRAQHLVAGPGGAGSGAHQPTRVICRSPTLVRVGPVRIRSPSASKKA